MGNQGDFSVFLESRGYSLESFQYQWPEAFAQLSAVLTADKGVVSLQAEPAAIVAALDESRGVVVAFFNDHINGLQELLQMNLDRPAAYAEYTAAVIAALDSEQMSISVPGGRIGQFTTDFTTPEGSDFVIPKAPVWWNLERLKQRIKETETLRDTALQELDRKIKFYESAGTGTIEITQSLWNTFYYAPETRYALP